MTSSRQSRWRPPGSRKRPNLGERFYWHNFTKIQLNSSEVATSVNDVVAQLRPTPRANLESIPVGGPFEMIAIDILELSVTPRGHKYVLVMSDYYTRWPEAINSIERSESGNAI